MRASVVSSVYASPVLEAGEHVLDPVAPPVEQRIIAVLDTVLGMRRDAGCDARFKNSSAHEPKKAKEKTRTLTVPAEPKHTRRAGHFSVEMPGQFLVKINTSSSACSRTLIHRFVRHHDHPDLRAASTKKCPPPRSARRLRLSVFRGFVLRPQVDRQPPGHLPFAELAQIVGGSGSIYRGLTTCARNKFLTMALFALPMDRCFVQSSPILAKPARVAEDSLQLLSR